MIASAVATSVVQALIGRAVRKTAGQGLVSPNTTDAIAEDITRHLMADPEAVNQLNAEPLRKSRVVQGVSFAAVTQALGVVFAFAFPEQDWIALFEAIGVLLGAAWALYGRVAGGLRPFG